MAARRDARGVEAGGEEKDNFSSLSEIACGIYVFEME
jgi:hypothetical protein